MSGQRSPLEAQYRRALLAYPPVWRKHNGDEIVGVLVDGAKTERRTTATTNELLNLIGSGLATRCEQILGWLPATGRDRIACLSLTIASALASMMLVLGELGRWFRYNSYSPGPGLFGPFTTPASVSYLLVLAAFVAAALGWHAARRILLALAIVAAAAIPLLTAVTGGIVHVGWAVSAVFIFASIFGLTGDPTHTTPLRHTLVYGAPMAALTLAFSSYLQGGGAQKWFYPGGIGIGANFLAFAAGCLLVAALLAFGVTGKWRPIAVLVALGSLSLPVRALFFMPNEMWVALATACVTAAFFIAWQVRQKQTGRN